MQEYLKHVKPAPVVREYYQYTSSLPACTFEKGLVIPFAEVKGGKFCSSLGVGVSFFS